MKRFKMVIMAIMFVVMIFIFSVQAGGCEKYWDELVNQCFETTIEDINYVACFGDSVFGPCPGGRGTLEYIDIQIIDEAEYQALVKTEFGYYTTSDAIIIGDLEFVLVDGRLILLPENPLIFRIMEE